MPANIEQQLFPDDIICLEKFSRDMHFSIGDSLSFL